jgi:long-chain acyl-CoA synthetase
MEQTSFLPPPPLAPVWPSESLARRALDVLKCRFIQAYGMTETSGTVVDLLPDDHETDGPRANLLRSIGRALPWVELRVIDPNTLDDAPTGSVGEIWIRSPQVMKGYWNMPDETAKSIDADGWFRSGDAGYLDADGYLYIHDRVKDMIISGGENVYPAEVERVLEACPGVQAAAVFGLPDETWGQTVAAALVAGPQPPDDETLAEHLARHAGLVAALRERPVVVETEAAGDRAALRAANGVSAAAGAASAATAAGSGGSAARWNLGGAALRRTN